MYDVVLIIISFKQWWNMHSKLKMVRYFVQTWFLVIFWRPQNRDWHTKKSIFFLVFYFYYISVGSNSVWKFLKVRVFLELNVRVLNIYQNFHKGFDLSLIYINVGLILPSKDSWYIPGPCAGSEEVLVENSNSGEKRSFFSWKLEWVWV